MTGNITNPRTTTIQHLHRLEQNTIVTITTMNIGGIIAANPAHTLVSTNGLMLNE